MLYYLIYVSKASAPMKQAGLLTILDTSRAWNEAHELTGMLFYIQSEPTVEQTGRFMQVIEGNEQAVREVFEKIKIDNRHDYVTLINEGPLKSRNFENWLVGFETVTTADVIKQPSYVELNLAFLNIIDKKRFNFALNFLKSFYELRSNIC